MWGVSYKQIEGIIQKGFAAYISTEKEYAVIAN